MSAFRLARVSEVLHQLFALEALLGGVTPWPASPEVFDLLPLPKPLGDVESYRFADWRNRAVTLSNDRCASAVYSRAGESYLLLANSDPNPLEVNCAVRPGGLPQPLTHVSSATRTTLKDIPGVSRGELAAAPLDASALVREGVKVDISAAGAVLVHVCQ